MFIKKSAVLVVFGSFLLATPGASALSTISSGQQSAAVVLTPAIPIFALTKGSAAAAGWILDYPDFAQAMATKKWTFELRPTGASIIEADDTAEFTLTDGSGKSLGYTDTSATTNRQASLVFEPNVYSFTLTGADLSKSLIATVAISRGYSSNLKDEKLSFSVPVDSFPVRPTSAGGYVKLLTSFSTTPIAYPKDCKDVEFQYTLNDPYGEISDISFSVIDAKGKIVDSTNAYSSDPGTLKSSISLCPSTLKASTAPYVFQTAVSFDSGTGRLQQTSNVTFKVQSASAQSDAFIASLGAVCQKGAAFKTVKGTNCPSGYKKIVFKSPSTVVWNSLVRVPSSQKGQNLVIYGCVVQFDANTGGSKFRAYTSPTQLQYYGLDGTNSLLAGSSKLLLKLSEKDAFLARVNVTGAYVYTTLGGRTTVPSFAIRDFVKMGSC